VSESSNFSLGEKRGFARRMRQEPTAAESALWTRLRKKQTGYHFQRQYMTRGFIVDFYCGRARLAIEVDGSIHERQDLAERDEQKEMVLANYGIGLLRFTNDEVFNELPIVLLKIKHECDVRMQSQTPLRGFGFDFRRTTQSPLVAGGGGGKVQDNNLPQPNPITPKAIHNSTGSRKSPGKPPISVEKPEANPATQAEIRQMVLDLDQKLRMMPRRQFEDPRPMAERAFSAKQQIELWTKRRARATTSPTKSEETA
jgi:very-short-patch-repair endonuclease